MKAKISFEIDLDGQMLAFLFNYLNASGETPDDFMYTLLIQKLRELWAQEKAFEKSRGF